MGLWSWLPAAIGTVLFWGCVIGAIMYFKNKWLELFFCLVITAIGVYAGASWLPRNAQESASTSAGDHWYYHQAPRPPKISNKGGVQYVKPDDPRDVGQWVIRFEVDQEHLPTEGFLVPDKAKNGQLWFVGKDGWSSFYVPW